MPSGKDRLYVALYARAGKAKMPGLEDTYHWALIIGPKKEHAESKGKRLHAIEKLSAGSDQAAAAPHWIYEERDITMLPTAMILARILVAKVLDRNALEAVIRRTPLRPDTDGWNCVSWVEEALTRIADAPNKVLGTSLVEWTAVRNAAMAYVKSKKDAHRYDGQAAYDQSKVPTWDLLEDREINP